jgi:tetratricopeptide (TPR) repeat protein
VSGSTSTPRKTRNWHPRRRAIFALIVGLIALASGYGQLKIRWDREREARAAVARAQDELRRGQPIRALRAVANVPESGPWEADLLTVKGIAYAALDRPELVRPVLERSMRLNPKQAMAAKVLAAVYFTGEEADRGFALLEQAARLDPGDFRPWFGAGDILLRFQNQPEEAVRAFREALRRQPDHEESRLGLIDALLTLGSTTEVAPLLEAALAERPSDPRVLRLAARQARLLGRPEEMNQYTEQVLAIDPAVPESLNLRASYLQLKGRPGEALPSAERAVELAPNDLAALSMLARLEGELGLRERSTATLARHRQASRRAERIRVLREEIQKRPDDPEPRWQMGRVAAEGGMKSLAVLSFRVALALDPRCQPAREGLAALEVPVDLPNLSTSR